MRQARLDPKEERPAVGKILVIGVTCVDVVINVDHLPSTEEDVLVKSQKMTLGGCAFNAYWVMHSLGEPSILFSPIGKGAYGDFVRNALGAEGIASPIADARGENGCCYCFVEGGGERSFIAHHGQEYLYDKGWFDRINMDEVDSIYVCGLEIEEPTGTYVVDFLERRCTGKAIFFTPGPRPDKVPADRLSRIYDLHPILHLNDTESIASAERVTGTKPATVREAAAALHARTGNTVFVTVGRKGCYYEAGPEQGTVPEAPLAHRVDTIGAGDAHIGALMACLHRGDTVEDSVACANRVAAAVVGTAGAHPEARVVREAASTPAGCLIVESA